MAKYKQKGGTASYIADLYIQDSTSATGGGLAGLTNSTTGLVAWYKRVGQSSWTQITLAAGTAGTWASGGFVANNPTGDAGNYELGIPNAALAAGAAHVVVRLFGAAGMVPCEVEIELDGVDYQDGAAFGLSRLDQTVGSRSTFNGGAVSSVTGSVGSISGVTFPARFGLLAIDGAGAVTFNNTLPDQAAPPSVSQIAAAILATPANKLVTDASGKVGVNNLPLEYLSTAEMGELVTAVSGLATLLARADEATTIGSIQAAVNAIKLKTDALPAQPASRSDVQLTVVKDNL